MSGWTNAQDEIEDLQQENIRLRDQIEAMKNCQNCKFVCLDQDENDNDIWICVHPERWLGHSPNPKFNCGKEMKYWQLKDCCAAHNGKEGK